MGGILIVKGTCQKLERIGLSLTNVDGLVNRTTFTEAGSCQDPIVTNVFADNHSSPNTGYELRIGEGHLSTI